MNPSAQADTRDFATPDQAGLRRDTADQSGAVSAAALIRALRTHDGYTASHRE